MQIKRMERSDCSPTSQLIERTIRTVNARFYPPVIVESAVKHYSRLEQKNESARFIIKENNEIIATIGLIGNVVCGLFVDPKHQKKGIGKMLMEKVEQLARERGEKELVLFSSVNAVEFYLNLGYKTECDVTDDILGKTIKMRKSLQ